MSLTVPVLTVALKYQCSTLFLYPGSVIVHLIVAKYFKLKSRKKTMCHSKCNRNPRQTFICKLLDPRVPERMTKLKFSIKCS